MKTKYFLLASVFVALSFGTGFFAVSAKSGDNFKVPSIASQHVCETLNVDGFLVEKGDSLEYKFKAVSGYKMTASIENVTHESDEGPVMVGSVIAPDGSEDGNVGGKFFEESLKQTGVYTIRVKQNEAKSAAKMIRFKLKITLKE